MITYRPQRHPLTVSARLQCIKNSTATLVSNHSHTAAVDLLLELGELEAGVADSLCAEYDDITHPLMLLRKASVSVGHLLYGSWYRKTEGKALWIRQLLALLDQLSMCTLPHTIEIGVPEGYAYYALYPETYMESARLFASQIAPKRAVCLGIRSIGTSLSAAVAAALEQHGCDVETFTLRPRGHPFERTLSLSGSLIEMLVRCRRSHFLVIDEGPGLSGSSFGSVISKLLELGVRSEQIVLFPSWLPTDPQLVSQKSQCLWREHKKFYTPFEQIINHEHLLGKLVTPATIDFSAGSWRNIIYSDPTEFPAVQPQHERRKYLVKRASPIANLANKPAYGNSPALLLKFAGLGKYGRCKIERANSLALAGFAPPVLDFQHGFVVSPFVCGTPLKQETPALTIVDKFGKYLAFIKTHFSHEGGPTPLEHIRQMAQVNITEAFGASWLKPFHFLESQLTKTEQSTALDGRMFPHEWLRTTDSNYLKTDPLDHYDDHFFPGPVDSAWDVAGTCIEFHLGPKEEARLVRQYVRHSGDRGVSSRLAFYRVAYLSFRMAYCRLAMGNTDGCDHTKFQRLEASYQSQLLRYLSMSSSRS